MVTVMMTTMTRVPVEGMTGCGCVKKDTVISTLRKKGDDVPKLHPRHPSSQGMHSS